MLANYDVKEKRIGDNVYYVRALPPLVALELLGDLQAVVTTSFNDGIQVAEENVMDSNINIGNMIAGIGRNLKGPALVGFTKRLLHPDYVSVKRIGDEVPVKLDWAAVDTIFTGKLSQMMGLIYFALEVNYEDFFGLIPQGSGILKLLKEQQPKSPEK